jgi:predicted negative regulator of RcsB-dependent stress response
MNRPKKNKVHNPTLPENQQDTVDERNLVETGQSEEISIEDRISIYWQENKAFISGCIALLALIIIGINGARIYSSIALERTQAAYAEAKAAGTLAEFAQANSGHALGGLAALEIAQEAFAAEDFGRAVEFFALAVPALEESILLGRARLGLAFAHYYDGAEEEGLARLTALAEDASVPESARAEAAYHLAVEADVAGRSDEFDRWVAVIESSPMAAAWQQRIMMYQEQAR